MMHLMMFYTMNYIFLFIMVMMSVAFYTLMERKMMAYLQSRKGPNKTSIAGILQPIADAMKLLTKELNLNYKTNQASFFMSPTANIFCSLILWTVMPQKFEFSFMKLSLLFLMSVMALNAISIMYMSWSSNSNYAFIGMIRTISQLISYEVNLIMIISTLINLNEEMNLATMNKMKMTTPMMIMTFPILTMWMITIMAETNRTPFDFSEGESELISGFNIEYSSTKFMILFLAEYSSILFMSMMTSIIFIKTELTHTKFYLTYSLFFSIFIWARVTLPRFRYDKLMKLNWMQILPLTTIMLLMSFAIKLI